MMKYIYKYKYFFIAFALVLAILPLKAHAANRFDIVGWRDESRHNAVTGVKINGVALSEYNPSMFESVSSLNRVTEAESSWLSVEITLEDGYTLSTGSSTLYLSGVQSEADHITVSNSATSIQLPSAAASETDKELYLVFKTEREPEPGSTGMTPIDSVVVDVSGLDCAAEISEDLALDVSVPSGKGYAVVPDSVCPVEKQGINYIENITPFTAGSRESVIYKLDLTDRGSYIFSESLDADDITINNGTLLDSYMITFDGSDDESVVHELCLTVSINAGHTWGEWTQTVAPTCNKPGTEERVCKNDANHKETREVAIDPNAHSWDDGKVTTAPTYTKPGVMTYTCTGCKATRTESIPMLDDELLATMKAKGKTSFVISWTKVPDADGYDIFFNKCDGKESGTMKKVKTVKGNKTLKWTKKGLKKQTAYKAHVKAWKMEISKKTYIKQSLTVHAFTSGGSKKYSNPKSVTVKKATVTLEKGKTSKIKASVKKVDKKKKLIPKTHAAKLRYLSTDKKVATVDKSGKITAVGTGTCKIYAVTVNGAYKAVNVTVK